MVSRIFLISIFQDATPMLAIWRKSKSPERRELIFPATSLLSL